MRIDENVVKTTRVYTGKIINVEQWDVLLPNGEQARRDIVLHDGACAVIPVDDEGMVPMVEQYRVALMERTLEIPAGKLDMPGEDPLAAARRELSEETGYTAESWTYLCSIVSAIGFCNERISIYLAQGLTAGASHPDGDEFLNVRHMPLKELADMAMAGRLEDAKTVCAVLMAARMLGV